MIEDMGGLGYLIRKPYRKSAQLAGPALLVDGHNLGKLAGDAEQPGPGLEIAQRMHVHDVFRKQGSQACGEGRDQHGGHARAAAVSEDQDGDDDVLAHDEGRLAKGAEGEAVAHVVCQRDEVGGRLEEVGQEGHALGRLGVEELGNLRDLDDGGGGDDADAEAFANGVFDAFRVVEVDV